MNRKNGAKAPKGSACLKKVEWAFLQAIQNVYGQIDLHPVGDAAIHRFHVPGDRSDSKNGWYVLFTDGVASGCFGSWKVGDSHTWSSRKPANPIEAELMRQRIEQAKRQRKAENHKRHFAAAVKAKALWKISLPANPDHPYLQVKGVQPYNLHQRGSALLVPLYQGMELVNLQTIESDGSKRFMTGGQVKGAYSLIGKPRRNQMLYICEGWATGATIHEQTGCAVACATNAGNLKSIALALKSQYPDSTLIIAGDDDRLTGGNPGRTAAMAAALAADAQVIFPEWPNDAPATLTDFNDLANWRAGRG